MYDIKALYEAQSVAEASQLLLQHEGSKILAGGSDILIQIREGRLAGGTFISIQKLAELRPIKLLEDGCLHIGSLASFSQISRHPLIQEHVPVLGKAVALVGGPQIRNIGTIGGNTCNGVTSADSAATLLAFDAEVLLYGPAGYRRLPLEEFYLKAGQVDLRPGELQLAILIPQTAYSGYKGHYIKYAMRNAMDIATLSCSLNLKLAADGKTIADLRLAYGVAGPIPLRARRAEAVLRGQELSPALLKAFLDATLEDVQPRSSWRASKEFRLHLIQATAKRALEEAWRESGASVWPAELHNKEV